MTSQLLRARQTAAKVVEGREVPLIELPDLNDVQAGAFEDGTSAAYVEWLATAGAMGAVAPAGGESLRDAVGRYLRAFEWLVRRPEERLLVVTHALPIALVLHADEAAEPPPAELLVGLFAQRKGMYGIQGAVSHATPYRVTRAHLRRAVDYWVDLSTVDSEARSSSSARSDGDGGADLGRSP